MVKLNQVCKDCLVWLVKDVKRLQSLNGKLERFDWDQFFNTRGIDYKGDEVKTAREFCWGNIAPALPKEIGRVPLAEVCSLGARHYVENLDLYIKPREKWIVRRAPRVMVPEAEWPEVCTGLVRSGVCGLMPADELFQVDGRPLLNGLFGVTKDEWEGDFEVFRLIMNLTPLNGIAEPIKGDVRYPANVEFDEPLLPSTRGKHYWLAVKTFAASFKPWRYLLPGTSF